MSIKLNFTKRALEALETPAEKRAIYHDEQTRGLVFKIEPSNHRAFAWYKFVRGTATWKNLGTFPDLSIEDARRRASELNVRLAAWKASGYEGVNPFEKPAGAVTLDALVELYVERHLMAHAKRPAQAAASVRWQIAKYVPALRQRAITSIQHEEVAALHRKIGAKHQRTANSTVKLLRTLFNFARRARLYSGENPGRDHMLYREESRSRFLQPDELPRLWEALSRAPNVDLRDFVNLSLWCGARKSDVMSMRWQDLNIDGGNVWTIPDPKSRRPYTVPLTNEATEILKQRLGRAEAEERKTGIAKSAYVFPSHGKSGHLVDLKKAWRLLLKDAALDYEGQPELRLRQHDLRRSYGSYLAVTNASMPIISRALGHADAGGATKVYAQLNLQPVREALEAAQKVMKTAMTAKPKRPQLPAAPKPKRKAARRG